MKSDDESHHTKLVAELKRRLRILEIQASKYGLDAPSHILIEIEDTKNEIRNLERRYDKEDSNQIDLRYQDYLYHFNKRIFASSIRLTGADDDFFPQKTVHIIPSNEEYILPPDILVIKDKVVKILQKRAEKNGAMFFDGPNTRLIDYRVTPVDETEQKHLELKLGPVRWYDYSVSKWVLDQKLKYRLTEEVQEYIDLEEIVDSGTIRSNKLTNILCTASTIVTSDGFVLYSRRGRGTEVERRKLTSSIAENIHQEKDGSLRHQQEGEISSPFRTVIRGIEEEASPVLAEYVRSNPQSIFLLGLDFDLLSFQPDLLFAVFLPYSCKKILDICKVTPGKDFTEGQVKGVSGLRNPKNIGSLLSESDWIPGGKASLIRTVEFLRSNMRKYQYTGLNDLIKSLEDKNR